MGTLTDFFDEYSLKARVLPAFLVLLPIGLAAVAWSHDFSPSWRHLGVLIVYCGGVFLLSQLGRDSGRKKQEILFKLWGGKPTTRMLRHRHTALDRITLERYHTKLSQLLSKPFPSKMQESTDKKGADELYEASVKVLLERTRDQSKYPLVFRENVNYGFRRNLWGMKPAAIFICATCLIGSLAPIGLAIYNNESISGPAVVSSVSIVFLLVLWVLRITPDWVKLTSEAYAMRLLASCEIMEN